MRDRIARLSCGDDGGRELAEPCRRDASVANGLADLWHGEPEVAGDDVAQRSRFAAAVLGASGVEEDLAPEQDAPAPVAGLPAERGVARHAARARPAGAVDARAADDGDRVACVGAGAEQREDVIVDRRPLDPRLSLERGCEGGAVAGDVDAAEVEDAAARGRVGEVPLDEPAEEGNRRLGPDRVRVVPRPADAIEEVALEIGDDDVCLRIAAVDAEDQRAQACERTATLRGRSAALDPPRLFGVIGPALNARRPDVARVSAPGRVASARLGNRTAARSVQLLARRASGTGRAS